MINYCFLYITVLLIGLSSCGADAATWPQANRFRCMVELAHPKKPQPDYEAIYASKQTEDQLTEYFVHYKLDGDFDGDGTIETLYESLMSRVTGKQIDSVVYKNSFWGYDEHVEALCDLEPVLKLKTTTGLNDLYISEGQIFGILTWENLGNINTASGDEIALISDNADWSSMNECEIYSYCGDEWYEVFSYEIREWQLQDHETMTLEFSQILKKRKGVWKYLEEDFIEGGEQWKLLNDCNCPEKTEQ